jgi:hypothetical protein
MMTGNVPHEKCRAFPYYLSIISGNTFVGEADAVRI